MDCCIQHDFVKETKMVELSSLESWKKLLAAANIRKSCDGREYTENCKRHPRK